MERLDAVRAEIGFSMEKLELLAMPV